ncbi:MAG: 23S rRNA (guanosine(2251)-2'-O)-methyltransferase RlmB [Anaerolineae bacterium]|nr:23S rRNA (guanosine(2251)-2'-O)-methyltransferase RlmB [Promineifilum sp.]MCZ2115000.1 23S rRNA (guanosine(2251)-2'-O)-methyltransferase RlmB [Anaerolineae bacterium]
MAPSGSSAEALTRRHPVLEALRAGRRTIYRLHVEQSKGRHADGRELQSILEAARVAGVPVSTEDKSALDRLAQRFGADVKHQGVLLEVGPYPYAEPDEMLGLAERRGEKPLLLLLDLLHGPQNIGTLLRTAEACGVHGVILQDRRAPEITPAVVQYAAGATEHLLIAKVTNMVQTMRALKDAGVWLAGMDMDEEAHALGSIDLDMPLGIVVGHEGEGLRRLVRERCDFIIRLPMRGQVESLNAAVAGSILLYAAWQARGFNLAHDQQG